MVKIVNFVLCIFHPNFKNEPTLDPGDRPLGASVTLPLGAWSAVLGSWPAWASVRAGEGRADTGKAGDNRVLLAWGGREAAPVLPSLRPPVSHPGPTPQNQKPATSALVCYLSQPCAPTAAPLPEPSFSKNTEYKLIFM